MSHNLIPERINLLNFNPCSDIEIRSLMQHNSYENDLGSWVMNRHGLFCLSAILTKQNKKKQSTISPTDFFFILMFVHMIMQTYMCLCNTVLDALGDFAILCCTFPLTNHKRNLRTVISNSQIICWIQGPKKYLDT